MRPLKITIHNSGLDNLPEDESEALNIIIEISKHKFIEIIQTEEGENPHIEMDGIDKELDMLLFHIRYPDHLIQHGIHMPEYLKLKIEQYFKKIGKRNIPKDFSLDDLFFTRAHLELNQDLFVTYSRSLIENRSCDEIKITNPRTPVEALKVIGLFLRSRNEFNLSSHYSFKKGLFYWALLRYKLPAMWRYFGACVEAAEFRNDDILFLGNSILTKGVRAYQACDEIGKLFFQNQDNDTRDGMMYHFDYLTLLLSGILDSQARVIYRAYEIQKPKNEWDVSFRRNDFINELKKKDEKLASFLCDPYFMNISKLISNLRNTIHGANINTISFSSSKYPENSYMSITKSEGERVLSYCSKYGLLKDQGIILLGDMFFIEPYNFSRMLLEISLDIINSIAEMTNVEKLFPQDVTVPSLNSNPPNDDRIFAPEVGKRLNFLV